MLDKLPKIEEWQIKLGIVGVQLIAIAVLFAYIFSSPIDRDEKKRAKTPAMKTAVAQKSAQLTSLNDWQWHYKGSKTLDIPIGTAMALVIRDAKGGQNPSLVPVVGQHIESTRPVGPVELGDLPPLELGKKVWQLKGCKQCHTIEPGAAPKAGPTWVGLYGSDRTFADGTSGKADDAYITESIKNPRAKIVSGYPPAMATIPLKQKEIEGVIAFIKSLKDK